MDDSLARPLREGATPREVAVDIARLLDAGRAEEVVVLEVRELLQITSYFVLATGTSRRQLHAMSEEIDHTLEDDMGDQRASIEGYRESRWILLDYGTVVIHLFEGETRDYYALEQLWADATKVELPEDITAAAAPKPK